MSETKTKPLATTGPTNGDKKKLALTADFGMIYTIVHGGQIMAPVHATMTLYAGLGHIYKQAGYDQEAKEKVDKYLITASGYKHLNKVASISLVTPQSVIVDGRPVPNPHIERNPRTKAIESVNIRRMGIGFSPTGNIVVIDKTLFYNVYTYFIQSLQAKMKRAEWKTENGKRIKTETKEFPNCAVYGIEPEKPEQKGAWAFFPTEPPLGIWVNYEDQATIDCLEEHTQRQRFGDRMAATIVDRNILKDHPAIGATQVFPKQGQGGIQASVDVYGYRADNSPRDISSIMRQAEQGEASKDFEIKAEVIGAVDAEEEAVAREEVVGDEGAVDMGNPAKDKEPPPAFWKKQAEEKGGK
jgi:hypothetical protein